MSWVAIDDQFTDHPKVLAAGPLASWLFVCGLAYCARYLTDGFIPAAQVRKLADVENAGELVTALLTVGLWEVAEGGYRVHDYLDYQPSASEVKAKRAATTQRVAAWRAKKAAPDVSPTTNNDVGNTVTNAVGNASPLPLPLPLPQREITSKVIADAAADAHARDEAPAAPGGDVNGHAQDLAMLCAQVTEAAGLRGHKPQHLALVLARHRARDPAALVAEAANAAAWIAEHPKRNRKMSPQFLDNWFKREWQRQEGGTPDATQRPATPDGRRTRGQPSAPSGGAQPNANGHRHGAYAHLVGHGRLPGGAGGQARQVAT